MNHRRTHPKPVEGCFGCKVLSVGFSAAAMPTRYPEPVRIDNADQRLTQDLAAYRRLRHAGFQPTHIEGSAAWERAEPTCQFEFDTGHLIPRKEMGRVQEALAVSKELGYVTDGGK